MTRTREQIYDELLVLRAQQQDEQAFAELVSRWQERLLGHALQLTGRADAAQDAVQETWVAVIRGLARLRDPARFPGFAHRILARKCADWTRRQVRQRRVATDFSAESPTASPAQELPDESDRVRRALERLSSDRRTILSLHYASEIPLTDIAGILRIPVGTVKSRLHHARQQLRRALYKEET